MVQLLPITGGEGSCCCCGCGEEGTHAACLRVAWADLDVEYSTGNSWIKDDQLTCMGKPPPECHRARVLETKAGEAWLDESTLAKWLEVDRAVVSAIVTEHKF